MTITEFLLARIAEDEMAIGGLAEVTYRPRITVTADGTEVRSTDPTNLKARLQAECEAKRRIVGRHRPSGEYDPDACVLCQWDIDCEAPRSLGSEGTGTFPCETLKDLASVYADHPDFDPAWRAK